VSANLAQALSRMSKLSKLQDFDPHYPGSRPTQAQQEVLDAVLQQKATYILVRAGNQCLAKGTLVATPAGPTPIEDIRPGDTVYSENGQPIKVLETFQNGVKIVYPLVCRTQPWAHATQEHVWQFGQFSRASGKFLKHFEASTAQIAEESSIRRVFVEPQMGTHTPFAPYALAAFLGDGCSRERRLSISGTPEVPQKVGEWLGVAPVRNHPSSYTWHFIDTPRLPDMYAQWCQGHYAHEKVADIDVLKTWDRASLVQFVAGLLDTDGSVHVTSTRAIVLSLNMQAKSVIDAFAWVCLALWQVPMTRKVDSRVKYVNGAVHIALTKTQSDIKRILREVQPFLASPQKHWKPEYENYGKRTRPGYVKVTRVNQPQEMPTFDIHVDSPTNLYLLANGMVTHNSGKTSTIAKAFGVMLREHPEGGWQRPEHWKGPLQLLALGRLSKQVDESIWPRIRAHLEPDTFKEVKIGNALQKVVHDNGNSILFFSHHNPRQAQQAVQSFTSHFAWVDELPSEWALLEELQKRVAKNKGGVVLTATPKIPAPKVRKALEGIPAHEKIEIPLGTLDNPAMDEKAKQTLIDLARAQGEAHLNTVLYGAWMVGDRQVFTYDPAQHMVNLPEHYHMQTWRHVLTVDPASASATGVLVTAEDPATGAWLVVHASYVEEREPAALVQKVEAIAKHYRIVRRIYDSAATWFDGSARAAGFRYMPIDHKAGRKIELIQNVNIALGNRIFLTPGAEELEEELQSAQWSESARENISHGHEYHISDCLQYFLDLVPIREATSSFVAPTYHAAIRAHNAPKGTPSERDTSSPKRITRCKSIRSTRAWLR
jgi:hypothetical protein